MLIELLSFLRCAMPHADSPLVVVATRTAGRRVVDGTLGCPVCGAEYPIRDGAAWFGEGEPARATTGPASTGPDETMRLAALLALNERGGVCVLGGSWGALAAELAELVAVQLMLVSPPAEISGWSTLYGTGDALPLAPGGAQGVAIDRTSGVLADAGARALRARGRLVAPSGTPLPATITLLARDERHWVGERTPDLSPISLITPRRAAPRTENR
jgi:uncharacterized protein YbaR (Trm112 family)